MYGCVGSYDGYVRLWKLDSKLKSFSPLGSSSGGIPIPGFINSLQLLQPPKSFFSNTISQNKTTTTSAAWPPVLPTSTATPPVQAGVGPVLIVAGTGQEHRFGRWLSIKNSTTTAGEGGEREGGGGAVNAAYIIALIPDSQPISENGVGSELRTLNGVVDR
jgi:ribosomal RNA-processing protein 9